MRIIRVFGNSGSGKTHFIVSAIKKLRNKFDYRIGIIKNIHEHEIDKKGKDSYAYSQAGAVFSVTRNIYGENTIFLKKEINIEDLIDWLSMSPYKIDLILIEGFKDLSYPTVLCVKNKEELKQLLDKNAKMISGLITNEDFEKNLYENIPIIDIEKDFLKFVEIFNLEKL